MKSKVFISFILVCCFLWVTYTMPTALSCDSCGKECASACGTRHFRSCCFNYLKKRSPSPLLFDMQPPEVKLELWLEKNKIAAAARNTLEENVERIQQNLIQHQKQSQHQPQQMIMMGPRENDIILKPIDQLDGERLQLFYDA